MARIYTADTVADLYHAAVHDVTKTPDHITGPRGLKTKECRDVTLVHTAPGQDSGCFTHPARSTKIHYLTEELAWYLSGSNKADHISHAAKMWEKIQEPNGTVNSAYGYTVFRPERIGNEHLSQWDRCVRLLRDDPETRQAVLVFHSPQWHPVKTQDAPCTLGAHFLQRDGSLHLTTNMRSQDLWFGYPYDAPWFLLILRLMAREIGTRRVGTWTHHVSSLHAYEKDWKTLRQIAEADKIDTAPYPLQDFALEPATGLFCTPPFTRMRGPLMERIWDTETMRRITGDD